MTIEDRILLTLGYRAWKVFAALFPSYLTVRQANDPAFDGFSVARFPFFVVWPMRWFRGCQIAYLTWKVRKRSA